MPYSSSPRRKVRTPAGVGLGARGLVLGHVLGVGDHVHGVANRVMKFNQVGGRSRRNWSSSSAAKMQLACRHLTRPRGGLRDDPARSGGAELPLACIRPCASPQPELVAAAALLDQPRRSAAWLVHLADHSADLRDALRRLLGVGAGDLGHHRHLLDAPPRALHEVAAARVDPAPPAAGFAPTEATISVLSRGACRNASPAHATSAPPPPKPALLAGGRLPPRR